MILLNIQIFAKLEKDDLKRIHIISTIKYLYLSQFTFNSSYQSYSIMILRRIIFLIVITVFIDFSLKAQTEQGKILVGGNTSFNVHYTSTINKDTVPQILSSVTKVIISPTIGIFALDNFAIGINVPIAFSTSRVSEDGTELSYIASNSFGVSTFFRKYFSDSEVKPYLQGEFGFNITSTKGETELGMPVYYHGGENSKTSYFYGGVYLGASVFIKDNIAFDGLTGFILGKNSEGLITSDINFGIGIIVVL